MPLAAGRQPWVHPPKFSGYRLEPDLMSASLGQAPSESVAPAKRSALVINLPRPDGTYERFNIVESPVMEEGLAAKFPSIRTYAAQGIDDPTARARLDLTPLGFHAQVFSARGGYYIDPYWRNDRETYASYFVRDYTVAGKDWSCGVVADAASSALSAPAAARGPDLMKSNGDTLRKFRVAVAAPGEYTTFYGGTTTGAMAGIVTTINRVNQLYENDLAIRMLIVSNNDQIVYTNAATDPYTLTSCTFLLAQNQSNIDSVIGDANYDIGHVVNDSTGGGLATLGVVCRTGLKARGCTGSTSPVGDAFDIDYVAHEMGHEFAAQHTFNGETGSCSGSNRNGPTAYEPGSASTIMGYAGICGVDNLQPHSDSYFLFASITQILGYVETTGTCSTNVATGNTIPTVNAGPNCTIPKSTPFELTASGSDGDGDTLTYCWEEKDLGASRLLTEPDNGFSPLFRSFSPTTSPTRIFPQLARILSNTNSNDEKLPSLARTMTFRVTVRDNRAGGGGVNDDDAVLTVVTQAGPFQVTSPNTSVTWSGMSTVTWNVANTDLSPVNTTNVIILLSTDGGQSFGTVLASNTANDGSQLVTLPNVSATNARVKVRAATNIFFDISDANFTIAPSGAYFAASGPHAIDDSAGNNTGGIDPGESGVKLYVRIQNVGPGAATGVSATLTNLTATALVTTPTSSYPDIAASATASNNSPFVFKLSASHACTSPVSLRITVATSGGTNSADFTVSPGAIQTTTNSFNVTTNIPDNNTNGVSIPFVIPDLGIIQDVDFRFDGTSCSTDPLSTTVGLNHDWIGDIVVKLTNPTTGTVVTLINRPRAGNCQGHNFCQTRLDDDGAFPSIQSIALDGSDSPHTGTWRPTNSLSAFDAQSAGGTWILNVSDRGALDTGAVHAFSLIVTASACTPVANPDFDSDGMPDAWETANGLNPNVSNSPGADADGDLVSDLSEYIADTVPSSSASYLKLNVLSNTGPRSIQFGPSSTGRIYTLQYVDDLVPGTWSNIPDQVDLPGDGTSQDVLSDTNGTPDRRVYRIGVELP
ncbi:MAG: zinc-dependent metalloprotease family protein [bacterium]